MRVDLPEGQHAILRDRLSYEQGKIVRTALLRVEVDRANLVDLDAALLTAYVESWNVTNGAGKILPVGAHHAPDDAVQTIAIEAMKLWKGRADPKGTGESSLSTPPAQP